MADSRYPQLEDQDTRTTDKEDEKDSFPLITPAYLLQKLSQEYGSNDPSLDTQEPEAVIDHKPVRFDQFPDWEFPVTPRHRDFVYCEDIDRPVLCNSNYEDDDFDALRYFLPKEKDWAAAEQFSEIYTQINHYTELIKEAELARQGCKKSDTKASSSPVPQPQVNKCTTIQPHQSNSHLSRSHPELPAFEPSIPLSFQTQRVPLPLMPPNSSNLTSHSDFSLSNTNNAMLDTITKQLLSLNANLLATSPDTSASNYTSGPRPITKAPDQPFPSDTNNSVFYPRFPMPDTYFPEPNNNPATSKLLSLINPKASYPYHHESNLNIPNQNTNTTAQQFSSNPSLQASNPYVNGPNSNIPRTNTNTENHQFSSSTNHFTSNPYVQESKMNVPRPSTNTTAQPLLPDPNVQETNPYVHESNNNVRRPNNNTASQPLLPHPNLQPSYPYVTESNTNVRRPNTNNISQPLLPTPDVQASNHYTHESNTNITRPNINTASQQFSSNFNHLASNPYVHESNTNVPRPDDYNMSSEHFPAITDSYARNTSSPAANSDVLSYSNALSGQHNNGTSQREYVAPHRNGTTYPSNDTASHSNGTSHRNGTTQQSNGTTSQSNGTNFQTDYSAPPTRNCSPNNSTNDDLSDIDINVGFTELWEKFKQRARNNNSASHNQRSPSKSDDSSQRNTDPSPSITEPSSKNTVTSPKKVWSSTPKNAWSSASQNVPSAPNNEGTSLNNNGAWPSKNGGSTPKKKKSKKKKGSNAGNNNQSNQ